MCGSTSLLLSTRLKSIFQSALVTSRHFCPQGTCPSPLQPLPGLCHHLIPCFCQLPTSVAPHPANGDFVPFPPPPPLFDVEEQRAALVTFDHSCWEPPGSEQSRLCLPQFGTCFYFLGPNLCPLEASSCRQLAGWGRDTLFKHPPQGCPASITS